MTIAQIERALADLRSEDPGAAPLLRTSVMTHLAWLPPEWVDRGRETLAGLAERHPSRTILLIPSPEATDDRLDAVVRLEQFSTGPSEDEIATEVIELHLLGTRTKAPASIVEPLLIFDLPVFLRWRGLPPFGSDELAQLVDVTDRLIVDSTEWPGLPRPYAELAGLFDKAAVSDIAWARTSRWRAHLATFWPEIGRVRTIRIRATAAQAHLLQGWLSSRLGHRFELEHEPAERLEGVALDGEPVPLPPGDPPSPSELLSDELDSYDRDRIYEQAAVAAASPE
ncbi:MAG TPA: glucose-6-phosphate dehydrogenase assembly protein OpcA [Gaiellaceae bacterium]|nr:glucose-6-phosphate dehydrogenase assembly protein OpcA [Gaiellaceae bacterium]